MTPKLKLLITGLFFLIALTLVYSNHFNNGFYFDDTHTITNNQAITSLDNLSSFFLDANTFSSLPANRAYRPMVTTLNAISYKLGGGLDSNWFHIHMFFWFLVQLVVMYFFIFNLLEKIIPGRLNPYLSIAAVVFYGFHTANAETINYLISISDSFSTLCIVATLLFFQIESFRKNYIYLIPLVLGIYTKQTTLMVVPILFIYILLAEEDILQVKTARDLIQKGISSIRTIFPAIVLGFGMFLMNQLLFTPSSTVSLDSDASKIQYFYTQFYIVTHYLWNFILPTKLSADPDFLIFNSFWNWRVLFGLGVILSMLTISVFSFRKRETSLIGFGILWFFIGLLPTSSFIPLFQIANDHRTFFPYIGLVISLIGLAAYLFKVYESKIDQRKMMLFSTLFLLIVGGYAYGTYQRNEVWNTSESLWLDVTEKSPKNGRGMMNYALTQMNLGKYERTQEYYDKALKLLPYYSYLQINIAILKVNMGLNNEAEPYFQQALNFDKNNPECYFYYADWLTKNGRYAEAINLLKSGVQLGPNHTRMNQLYQKLSVMQNIDQPSNVSTGINIPDGLTENDYINISLQMYRNKNFEACILACEKALQQNPQSATAYNNMCSAYNNLKMWDKALVACKNALAIDPNFELAKNNLQWARSEYHKLKGN